MAIIILMSSEFTEGIYDSYNCYGMMLLETGTNLLQFLVAHTDITQW